MSSIIRLQTCATCKHSINVNQPGAQGPQPLECRRYPPSVTILLVPIAKDKMIAQGHAASPQVNPDFHCGEWGTKFLKAEEAPACR